MIKHVVDCEVQVSCKSYQCGGFETQQGLQNGSLEHLSPLQHQLDSLPCSRSHLVPFLKACWRSWRRILPGLNLLMGAGHQAGSMWRSWGSGICPSKMLTIKGSLPSQYFWIRQHWASCQLSQLWVYHLDDAVKTWQDHLVKNLTSCSCSYLEQSIKLAEFDAWSHSLKGWFRQSIGLALGLMIWTHLGDIVSFLLLSLFVPFIDDPHQSAHLYDAM